MRAEAKSEPRGAVAVRKTDGWQGPSKSAGPRFGLSLHPDPSVLRLRNDEATCISFASLVPSTTKKESGPPNLQDSWAAARLTGRSKHI